MGTVTINPPKTPVTQGSNGVASATVPNVCKMPGPPAPFVPTPLPNIGRSGLRPTGYSVKVKIEGKSVAIRGATFGSQGDIASKASGGGLVSANAEGPTKFVGPGSMDVTIEGKNVQLLGDPMLNNCGPSGSPPNAATMIGVLQPSGLFVMVEATKDCPLCHKSHEELAESKESQVDAGKLDEQFTLATAPFTLEGKRQRTKQSTTTMLGVVHGKCGTKYGGQSGIVYRELCVAAGRSGMEHFNVESPSYFNELKKEHKDPLAEVSEEAVLSGMKALLGDSNVLKKTWSKTKKAAQKSLELRESAPFVSYPPGACAAQKTILLARERSCMPTALTELWHSKNETRGKVRFRNEKGKLETRKFDPGKSVPPCGTCCKLLPLLLCPGDAPPVCSHPGLGASPLEAKLPSKVTRPAEPMGPALHSGTPPSGQAQAAKPAAPVPRQGTSAPFRGGGGGGGGGGASGDW